MKQVELYAKVRYAVQIEGLNERAAARRFGIDPRTVAKMVAFSVPPGYRRTKPPVRPKLDAVIAIIDGILAEDKGRPKKQQHTAKRMFERLRDEHGFTGGITIVKDYVAGWRQRAQEMFVPLVHPPGHAQADFGEAIGIIGGAERKIHFFAFDLPHSDACFVVAYPAETTEAFCDGGRIACLGVLMSGYKVGNGQAGGDHQPVARRRRWTIEEKVAILDEASQPRASITAVADRHGISRNLIYLWRRQAREGSMPGVTVSNGAPSPFVAVRVADSAEDAPPGQAMQKRLPPPTGRRRTGLIEIALWNGRVVKVEESIDPATLARIVAAVDGSA